MRSFLKFSLLNNWGQHNKPITILNTCGYYNPMLKMLETTVTEGFMSGLAYPCIRYSMSRKHYWTMLNITIPPHWIYTN